MSTFFEKKIVKNLLSPLLFVIGRIHSNPPVGTTELGGLFCEVSPGPDGVAASPGLCLYRYHISYEGGSPIRNLQTVFTKCPPANIR